MLIGKESPDDGEIKIGETVNIVSVGQERMDELNADKTVFEEISEGMDDIQLGTQSIASRAYLSWFGFKGQSQQAKVGNLSGGERNRVQLAKLLKAGGNVSYGRCEGSRLSFLLKILTLTFVWFNVVFYCCS